MGMKFDPMTGKPIQEAGQFDPMTGKPIQGAGQAAGTTMLKKKSKFKILGIIGAVAVVAVVGVVGVKSGLLLGKGNKVLLATKNTFEQPEFLKDLEVNKLLNSKKYTIDITGSMEDVDFNVTLASKKKNKSISGEVSVGAIKLDAIGGIEDKTLAISIPFIDDDTVFTYDYSKENDGYLVEYLEDEMGISQEILNESIDVVASGKTDGDIVEDIEKATLKWFRGLKFSKLSKEKFEVNGKSVSCKGYGTVLTGDNVAEYAESLHTVWEEYLKENEEIAKIDEVEDLLDEVDEIFDKMEELEDVEDTTINFYIYKNKLACVQLECDGNEMELQFQGGDTRMQNVCLEVEGKEVIVLEGNINGKEESYELEVAGEKMAEMTYNMKSGEYAIDMGAGLLGQAVAVEGVLTAKGKEKTFTVEEIEVMGQDMPMNFSVNMKSDAEIVMPKGEEFDVGNASESDLEDMIEDMVEKYQGVFANVL